MSLKQKSFSNFIWSFISRTTSRFALFVVSIVLSRILEPRDFGLLAMVTVLLSISGTLVDGGFVSALVREKKITEEDKSTVFYINIGISLTLYLILWFSAAFISDFYKEPTLFWMIRISSIDIIIKGLSIVFRADLTHKMNFKLMAVVDIIAVVLSGSLGIFLAFHGFGVWSLIIKMLAASSLSLIIIVYLTPWYPKYFINKESFKRLFGFGSNLMITGIVNSIYSQGYNLIIGKFFSPVILGYYNRASLFVNQLLSSVNVAVSDATFPVLSKIDNNLSLKNSYSKVIKVSTFANVPISLFFAFCSKSIILVFLGEKWLDVVPFIQILSFGAAISHLPRINTNLLKVIKRSDLILYISIIVKIVTIVAIIIGVYYGIWILVVGSVIVQYFEVLINMFSIQKNINYKVKEQFLDYVPTILCIIPFFLTIYLINFLNISNIYIDLVLKLILSFTIYMGSALLIKESPLRLIADIVKPYFKNRDND